MFKKYEPVYHKAVFYYTLLFAIYTLFGRFALLHALVEHTVNVFLFIFAGLFGAFLLALDVFFFKNYRKMAHYWVYILFIFCAAISSALNVKYGFTSNISTILWLSIQMGLFTTMGHLFTREQYHKWLTLFFSVSGALWGLASAISLYQFVFVSGYRVFMNGRMIRQSLYDNRLFGIFIDPNLGSFVGFLVMWGMFYLMIRFKKKWLYVLGTFNCILQFLYIVLSGSRSTQVCMAISLSYTLIYAIIHHFPKKHTSQKPLQIFCCIVAPFVCTAVLLFTFSGLRAGLANVADSLSPENHTGASELIRKDIEEDSSNNRMDIWKGYLVLLKDRPIFGLSPRNAWNYADTEHPDSYLAQHHYDVHNAYIAVLAGMGIVGFLAMLLVIYCLLRTMIPRLFDAGRMTLPYFIALQLILNIAVFIIFYPGIFFTNGIDTVLFWSAVGFVLQDAEPLRLPFPKQDIKQPGE